MNRFDTLLVANRGEIACRIIESARKVGLRTVAVFSEADRGAKHVRLADEAVLLGPAPAKESYLRVDAILAAAAATGAGAIHPGYGFLSEDAGFAEAVEAAGLVFVGPTPEQLRIFGTKHTARDAAQRAGVPMIAGSGLLEDLDEAIAAAGTIGFPLMLKATGGGGGIGMAVCRTEAELAESYARVARLASSSFGTAGVFAERYIEHARHVEVQIFGDGEGRVVSLGDRDCSLQRRHQKVLEEAPAPDLPAGLREELHRSSRALCASVGYRSAGTVEFVYDPVTAGSILPRSERPSPGGAPGHGSRHRRRPRGMDAQPGPAAARAGRSPGQPPGDRARRGSTDLRGRPGPQLPAQRRNRHQRPTTRDPTSSALTRGWKPAARCPPTTTRSLASSSPSAPAGMRLSTPWRTPWRKPGMDGIETNLGMLRSVTGLDVVRTAAHSTGTLDTVGDPEPRITVERPGLQTSVQDWPGTDRPLAGGRAAERPHGRPVLPAGQQVAG